MQIDNIFAKSKYYIDEFLKYKSDMRKKRRLIKKNILIVVKVLMLIAWK